MIKCLFPSSPFKFILNKEVGGGEGLRSLSKSFSVKLTFSLRKLTLLGWNFGKTSSSLWKLTLLGCKTSFYFKPYRNPSLHNKFEFGG